MKQILIGLDPGTVHTGYAVIAVDKSPPALQDLGVVTATEKALEKRLYEIHKGLEKLYQQYCPRETAMEQIFMGKNADSAFKLGQAVGMCSVLAARFQSPVFFYPTRFVKQSVTGSGRADKETVKAFVCNLFDIKKPASTDATDALAVALCHSRQNTIPHALRSRP